MRSPLADQHHTWSAEHPMDGIQLGGAGHRPRSSEHHRRSRSNDSAVSRFARPGLDSEFYQLETRLAARGVRRHPSETLSAWLARAAVEPAIVQERQSFEELNQAELQIARLRLSDYLEPATSYLSVIELGLYESSLKTYKALADRGVEPHSDEWKKSIQETIARQKEAMKPRLFPSMPPNRYICFYPMDRRRGEDKNWYTLPMEERQRQMNEHGLVGRRYAGEVKQIITGSIGFDDWEWGVDLFADDPLVFKKLIYEMRFDHVSAVYALFGSFYIGLRCPANRLYDLLEGNLPGLDH